MHLLFEPSRSIEGSKEGWALNVWHQRGPFSGILVQVVVLHTPAHQKPNWKDYVKNLLEKNQFILILNHWLSGAEPTVHAQIPRSVSISYRRWAPEVHFQPRLLLLRLCVLLSRTRDSRVRVFLPSHWATGCTTVLSANYYAKKEGEGEKMAVHCAKKCFFSHFVQIPTKLSNLWSVVIVAVKCRRSRGFRNPRM